MPLRVFVVSACALLLASDGASAQATPADSMRRIEFPGGTLFAYLNLVREAFRPVNIVPDTIETGISRIRLPAAPLQRVNLMRALQWPTTTKVGRDHGLILQPMQAPRDGDVFVYTTSLTSTARARAADDYQVKSYAIPDYVRQDSVEVIRRAIDDDLKKQRDPTGTVTYSAVTRRIQVTGTRADILIADRLIDDYVGTRRVSGAIAQLQAELARMRQEVDSLKRAIRTGPQVSNPR